MHSQSGNIDWQRNTGAVVQLVRIHACHAWGRGFESRPHRRNPETKVSGFFVFRSISATLQHKILRKSAKVGRAAIQTARCASKEVHNVWQSESRQHRHRESPQSGRIDAATLCAIGEVHNVDPLSVNFYLCTINRKLRETLRIVKKKDRDGELLC